MNKNIKTLQLFTILFSLGVFMLSSVAFIYTLYQYQMNVSEFDEWENGIETTLNAERDHQAELGIEIQGLLQSKELSLKEEIPEEISEEIIQVLTSIDEFLKNNIITLSEDFLQGIDSFAQNIQKVTIALFVFFFFLACGGMILFTIAIVVRKRYASLIREFNQIQENREMLIAEKQILSGELNIAKELNHKLVMANKELRSRFLELKNANRD